MMIATAFLSMWVSNTATTLMMLPIGISVLSLVVENTGRKGSGPEEGATAEALHDGTAVSDLVEDRDVRLFGVALLLSIAWAASIGGLGTLLGSPPNAIVAGYIGTELGTNIWLPAVDAAGRFHRGRLPRAGLAGGHPGDLPLRPRRSLAGLCSPPTTSLLGR